MDFNKLSMLWIGTRVEVPYNIYIALRDWMDDVDKIYHQEIVKTTQVETTLDAECIMFKCDHRLLIVSSTGIVEDALRAMKRDKMCVEEMQQLYARFLPVVVKGLSVEEHWHAFLHRFFNPQFVKAVLVRPPKKGALSDGAMAAVSGYVYSIKNHFCQHLSDLNVKSPSDSVIDQLFVNFALAAFSALVRESGKHFNDLRGMHTYTCFRWCRADDTAETAVLRFDQPANGLEVRTIAFAMDVYARHFAWDDVPYYRVQDTLAYPAKYMWAMVAIGASLANATYTNSPFVSITHGVATNPVVLNSSYIAHLMNSEMREMKTTGLLQVLFTSFLTHCASAFCFRSTKSAVTSQRVLACNETELTLKLWFMFRALKPRLLALMADWRPMRWLDVEMFLNALFCVTLRAQEGDVKARHIFSPQIKYPIVRDFHAIVGRLLLQGHQDELLTYLKEMLTCGLAKVARLLGDGVDAAQIPVDFAENAHDVMHALFEFAYLAQLGTYPITDDETAMVQSIYLDYNVNAGAECSMRSALKKASPKYSAKKRTHDEMENNTEDDEQAEMVLNEKFFLHRCKHIDNEYELFSVMLRLMECHACPMCNELRHNCVHFSFFDESPQATLIRNFGGCRLMSGTLGFNIGVTGINRGVYKFFDGANDMGLRQAILNSSECTTFIDFTRLIPKLL